MKVHHLFDRTCPLGTVHNCQYLFLYAISIQEGGWVDRKSLYSRQLWSGWVGLPLYAISIQKQILTIMDGPLKWAIKSRNISGIFIIFYLAVLNVEWRGCWLMIIDYWLRNVNTRYQWTLAQPVFGQCPSDIPPGSLRLPESTFLQLAKFIVTFCYPVIRPIAISRNVYTEQWCFTFF